jgi:hypothetical protein
MLLHLIYKYVLIFLRYVWEYMCKVYPDLLLHTNIYFFTVVIKLP